MDSFLTQEVDGCAIYTIVMQEFVQDPQVQKMDNLADLSILALTH